MLYTSRGVLTSPINFGVLTHHRCAEHLVCWTHSNFYSVHYINRSAKTSWLFKWAQSKVCLCLLVLIRMIRSVFREFTLFTRRPSRSSICGVRLVDWQSSTEHPVGDGRFSTWVLLSWLDSLASRSTSILVLILLPYLVEWIWHIQQWRHPLLQELCCRQFHHSKVHWLYEY